MKNLPVCSAMIAAVVILPWAHAANEQEPIIVTATRTAQTADDSLASVTVITREDIEKSKALSVPEVLSGIAGIDVTTSGGFGKFTRVFMRGTADTQVLVLVDGIEIGSVSAGTTSWEFLPISEIERIEIVRGPRSALYGSEAIGGVIQVFTRKGKGPPRARASLGAGSHATSELSTGLSGGTDNNWFNVSLGRFRTNGIDAREPTVEFGAPVNEPDKDGYHNDSFSARIGHRFGNAMEIELHALQADGNTEFDNFATSGNEDDFTQQVVGMKYRVRPSARWNVLVEAGRSLDERRTFRDDGAAAQSRFDTEIRSFVWQNDLTFGADNLVTLGVDLRDDRLDSTQNLTETSRRDEAVFGQYQGKFGKHDLLVGLRADDNEQFGSETTGNVAWGYDLRNLTRLVISFGTAFRAPTFNDLFFPPFVIGGMVFATANPNLDPEKSKSLEIGLSGKHAYGHWDVRAYRTEIDDLIALDANFVPQNINQATIEGLEAEISANIADWMGRAAFSYVDPRDNATNNRLARRAKSTLKLELARGLGKTRMVLNIIAQSRRFNDPDNTIEVDGYGVVNLAVSHRLPRDWTLRGRLNNVFDKDYETVDTFNTLGRNVFITIAYEPNQ